VIGDVLQPTHLIFILVVALLVLGPKRLPEVGRSLGRGIRDFRGALSGTDDREQESTDGEGRNTDVPPVTPATTSLPADAQSAADRQVVPVGWSSGSGDPKESEEPGQNGLAPAESDRAGAADAVVPVANPFRGD
jgi:sec-independent protein translocase protein TatA